MAFGEVHGLNDGAAGVDGPPDMRRQLEGRRMKTIYANHFVLE